MQRARQKLTKDKTLMINFCFRLKQSENIFLLCSEAVQNHVWECFRHSHVQREHLQAVWPDCAIFKVLGDELSFKSSPNIRQNLGYLKKHHSWIKNYFDYFSLTFGQNLALLVTLLVYISISFPLFIALSHYLSPSFF